MRPCTPDVPAHALYYNGRWTPRQAVAATPPESSNAHSRRYMLPNNLSAQPPPSPLLAERPSTSRSANYSSPFLLKQMADSLPSTPRRPQTPTAATCSMSALQQADAASTSSLSLYQKNRRQGFRIPDVGGGPATSAPYERLELEQQTPSPPRGAPCAAAGKPTLAPTFSGRSRRNILADAARYYRSAAAAPPACPTPPR